ncbi:hypothetical protein [Streptomyces sp. KL116D]|uniref:hypothetical protein n=1 Tax=Streptomyces sp. KL116D TaxID=3045152 RepID=UPI0035573D1C
MHPDETTIAPHAQLLDAYWLDSPAPHPDTCLCSRDSSTALTQLQARTRLVHGITLAMFVLAGLTCLAW